MSFNDTAVRGAAMNYLNSLRERHGEILPISDLREGFIHKGELVHLISQQGIFKPRQLDLPLTITTTFNGPYDDIITDDYLTYKYRGNDPSFINQRDNVGLRTLMSKRIPLIYFHGVESGKYVAIFPVYIVDDHPELMEFTVAADDIRILSESIVEDIQSETGRRQYITREVRNRLHQSGFRARILKAYKDSCAFCRLQHPKLLDAAHIIPDTEEGGTAEVNNGMALCKIHHAAYDQHMIGVDSKQKIHVREDLLNEIDGPMLKHGIQSLHGTKLFAPKGSKKPDPVKLEWKFEKFLNLHF